MSPLERTNHAKQYAINCGDNSLHPAWIIACFVRHLFLGLLLRLSWACGRLIYMVFLWPIFSIIAGSKIGVWPSWKKAFAGPEGCPPTRFVFPDLGD